MLKITKNQGSIQVTADKSGFYPFDGTITFPTNSLFTATSANTDMITFKSTSNGDVQFVGNYKDITISGRSYDTKQKFLTAFSNLANQGSVDAYTKAETDAKLDAKQGKLKAGNGITLTEDATDNTTVVKTAVSLTDNGNGAYQVGDSIEIGGRSSVRIGNNNNVLQGQNSIVIGDHAVTSDEKCIVIGNNAKTYDYASNCVVIGDYASALSLCCTVIGDNARSKSLGAVAVGNKSYIDIDGYDAVAVGSDTKAYGKNSVAIGYSSNATNNNPLVINAGYKTVDGNDQPLTVLQSDSTGKLSILKGDGTDTRMVIQDEIEALKNAGGGGTVDAYTKAETDTKLDAKQDKLTAGTGITITKDETAGTSTIATAVSLTDNGNGAYQVGDSIKMGAGIAIGRNTDSSSTDTIAVGRAASTTGSSAIAIGASSSASGDYSIAIGCDTINDAINSVSIGYLSRAGNGDDDGSVIIGAAANGASGTTSTLIGFSASSSGFACTGIGPTARVDDTTPLVIKAGHKTVSDGEQILTMIQGDANGKISLLKGDGTDTRMVIQDEIEALKNAGGSGGSTNPLVNVKGTESATITDSVTNAVAIGSGATVSKDYGVCVGYKGESGIKSVAVGYNCYAVGDTSIAIGNSTRADNISGNSIAIGSGVTARSKGAIVIGANATSSAMYCLSIGYGAETDDTTPLVIKAGKDSNYNPLTMIQGDANGKISILLGDGTASTMCLQDEIAALKAEIAALKGGASTGA